MKEIGRVHVLKDGLAHDKSDYAKKGSTTRDTGIVPLDAGTEITFDYGVKLTAGDRRKMYAHSTDHGNGIVVTQFHDSIVVQPDSPLAMQPTPKPDTNTVIFGNTPGKKNSVEFGQPEPGVRITYLGHPMRDALEPLLKEQPSQSGETRVILNTDKDTGTLLFSGTPQQVIMHNLAAVDHRTNTELIGADAYPGTMVVGAYLLQSRSDDPQIEVFAAIKPESDGLIRVKDMESYVPTRGIGKGNDHGHASRMLDELAAVSVFSTMLGDPAFEELRLDFPLPFIESVGKDLHTRAIRGKPNGDSYSNLKEVFHMDWQAIRQDLPSEAVIAERERLADMLGVVYQEETVPAPVSEKRGRKGRTYKFYKGSGGMI